MDLIEELGRLVTALDRDGVEYALAGSLAAAIHRWPCASDTTEILVAEESLRAAVRSVASVGFAPSATRSDRPHSQRVSKLDGHTAERMTLDLLAVTCGLANVWSRRVRAHWRGGIVTLVSRDGLADGWPSHDGQPPRPPDRTGPMIRRAEPIHLSDEVVSQRLELVRALYRLRQSLRSAKILAGERPSATTSA